MYIQCIYKVRKTKEKTNRCQKINVQKRLNIRLQTEINLIDYWHTQTIDKHQSKKQKGG